LWEGSSQGWLAKDGLLSEGGALDDDTMRALGADLRRRLEAARSVGYVRRTPDAEQRWAELYALMADADGTGLADPVTARAEAQTLRLSMLYALLVGLLHRDWRRELNGRTSGR
jgi:hypothetical protein